MTVPVIRQPGTAPEGAVKALAEVVTGLQRPDRHDQLLALLGTERAVQRFITVSLHYLSGNSELMQRCTPLSILEAVREAATLDLEPTGMLGEAWIVRHGDKAVLRVGYRGFLKLLRNSGQLDAVDCQIVYMNDSFDIQLGTNSEIVHRPTLDTDRGTYRGAYAWARMRSGELIVEWMTEADIESVRAVSQAKNAMAWKDWWSEMARKSVIRRLVKRLPLSPEAARAVAVDESADDMEAATAAELQTRRKTLQLVARATGAELPDEQAKEKTEEELIQAALDAAQEADIDQALEKVDQGSSKP